MHANWILWCGLIGLFAAALVALSHTRWLHSQTLKKCVLLSVAFHALLAIVAACVGGMRPASWGRLDEGRMTMTVVLADEPAGVSIATPASESPETTDGGAADRRAEPEQVVAEAAAEPAAAAVKPSTEPAEQPTDLVPLLAAEEPAAPPAAVRGKEKGSSGDDRGGKPRDVPAPYADRVGARRAAAAAARGGSEQTERAVQAALAWLAQSQSADGRWSAAAHGGGVERAVEGHHRSHAGARSDHGVTGLALLAFLGAGQTHRGGAYADTVARGIRFLVDRQRADGSLAGEAEFFAALYCHGMATIAVAEACGMTGDQSLRPAVDAAVRHTLSMQSPSTGGWRYAAGDRGDTSQLGWQVMALSSARHAGLGGLEHAEARARVFLQSVSSGRAGGLAGYRPGERPSVAMTAEALVCRLFLGMPAEHQAAIEAVEMIAQSPPDSSAPNAYTWYYATLASFHAGGPQWDRWNGRLQAALLPLQRRESSGLDGSWDPDPVWGGHGGRVYSTALAAMTLEVYYRHLPMHKQPAGAVAALP